MEIFNKLIDSSIAYLVGRTSRSIIKRLTKKFSQSGFDVSYEQWSILVHLYRKDGQTQQELSNIAVKDKAAITRLLNVLEKKNIVLRVPDRNDKRSKLVYLTNKAKEFKTELIAIVEELLEEAEQGISSEEINQCKTTLNKIFLNFEQLDQ
ncbi:MULTISPECIES: MarR family winged helix-turn-helix transcriptional regulator [Desulfobacula]|uniref:Transcriptional regulator, MarR family n=2 Tax=Desulfobacula TaxID=28222 RepID=K0NN44_DESTT|nr:MULTISPECIES: MarR family transcriptional regulator [Desulfobacula]CCK82025.1 transcriptional regulator, MarR family [Desulfobacula toluolica Tol2]SDU47693.1 DNA-binding transcriptional regulator, MarR family [Desulfobacula phenolica]